MSNLFPKSANKLPLQIILYLVVLGGVVTAGATYYMTPKYTRVGYALGIDCRYCHSNVEKSGVANLPTSQTCMNCHNQVKKDSPLLAVVRHSYETGEAVPWVKIHQTPDYVYFNHAVHVNRGVSCVECHGKIDEMEVVAHAKPFSMGFCLDCHRNPATFVRAKADIYNLDSATIATQSGIEAAHKFLTDRNVKPPQSCSGCHR
jgi:formate-dependent nitrite reductase cytochrome c552 subunit